MHAVLLTNEAAKEVPNFYFNSITAAYRVRFAIRSAIFSRRKTWQASPKHGWSNQWKSNGDKIVETR